MGVDKIRSKEFQGKVIAVRNRTYYTCLTELMLDVGRHLQLLSGKYETHVLLRTSVFEPLLTVWQ